MLGPTPAHAVIPYDAQLTPGALRGIAHTPGDPWIYGYWEYLPAAFNPAAGQEWPLVVFLPGIGEYDDVSSCPGGVDVCTAGACGNDGLCRNLTWGPQQLIRNGDWDDVLRPFIVISPQHPVPPGSQTPWNIATLDDFIQFIVDEYPVDPRRLYLIGMSQGGRAVLQYTRDNPRRFAAVAPTPGGAVEESDTSCYFQDTALWVFHGEDDADGNLGPGVFAPCNMVGVAYQYDHPDVYVGSAQCQSIVGQPRPPGRLTMYHNVAHFSWIQTVDPIGSGFPASEWLADEGCGVPATFRAYSAALDPDGVYSWFLSLDRPDVAAPDDLVVDQPSTSLMAVITDDDTVTIEWTQTSGPAVTLNDTDTDTLDVSDMVPSEQYGFQIYVVDADGQWDLDDVIVTTADEFPPAGSTGDSGSSSDGSTSNGVGDTTSAMGSTSGVGSTTTPGDPNSTTGDVLDDTAGPISTSGGGSSGVGPGPGSSDDTSGAQTDPDPGSGCGCRAERPRGHDLAPWGAWAMVVLAAVRRRQRLTAARRPRATPRHPRRAG